MSATGRATTASAWGVVLGWLARADAPRIALRAAGALLALAFLARALRAGR